MFIIKKQYKIKCKLITIIKIWMGRQIRREKIKKAQTRVLLKFVFIIKIQLFTTDNVGGREREESTGNTI